MSPDLALCEGESALTWREFETMVGLVFRHQGYGVKVTSARTDCAVDLQIDRDGQSTLVQCKHWTDRDVGVGEVRKLASTVEAQNADAGYIVTSSSYTEEAWTEFGHNNEITLVDGLALKMLVAIALDSDLETLLLVSKAAPPCPSCRQVMATQVSERTRGVGETFWACASPECDGKRPVRKDISWAATV